MIEVIVLFSSTQSSCNDSLEKLSMPSEEIQEKPSKHKRNTSSRSNSSTQSSGSSREVELISQSSSPFTHKANENNSNNISDVSDDAQENLNLYKVPEQEESSSEYDPVLAAINDLKDLRLDEEYASSNSDVKSRSSKHDITLSDLASPEHSKCLLLDSLKSYVNSAVSTPIICFTRFAQN